MLPSERLAAATENVMLAPHWWQREAPAPTSVPHAGQSLGRGCSGWPPANKDFIFCRNRSSFMR
jgi:hypothetical protein